MASGYKNKEGKTGTINGVVVSKHGVYYRTVCYNTYECYAHRSFCPFYVCGIALLYTGTYWLELETLAYYS